MCVPSFAKRVVFVGFKGGIRSLICVSVWVRLVYGCEQKGERNGVLIKRVRCLFFDVGPCYCYDAD